MQISERTNPISTEVGPGNKIQLEITDALNAISTQGQRFVVNDTLWFQKTKKVNPCVVNAADYLSGSFQNRLEQLEWTKEKSLEGQKIDAFKEFELDGTIFKVPEHSFLDFMNLLPKGDIPPNALDSVFLELYQRYVKIGVLKLPDLERPLLNFFIEQEAKTFRVGVEFETGNIASSFRALTKLNILYVQDQLDIGVFVTSIDKKNAATRIWPTSNRNGSFEELDNRSYKGAFIVPLWEFGFAPDSFSNDAKYLAKDGSLYTIEETNERRMENDVEYVVCEGYQGQKLLRKADQPSLI